MTDVAWRECPFDSILPRTPYLVLPKLAIQAMPFEWRDRLAALLKEAEAVGIETPAYIVLRDADFSKEHGAARVVNRDTGFIKIVGRPNDPWADYRHGSIRALCPKYKGDHA